MGRLPGASAPSGERLTTLRYFRGNIHRIAALGVMEAVVCWTAFQFAMLVAIPANAYWIGQSIPGPYWPHGVLMSAVMFATLTSVGLYQLRQRARYTGVLARLIVAVGAASAGLEVLYLIAPTLFVGHGTLFLAGTLSFTGLALVRYGFMKVVDQEFFKRRVLVWGTGERAQSIVSRLRRRTDQRGFRVVGYVAAHGDPVCIPREEMVSPGQNLLEFVVRNRVHEVVVAMDDRRGVFPARFLRECRLRGIEVVDIMEFLERETGRVSVELARPSFLIYGTGFRSDFVRCAAKRVFDLSASILLLVLSAPVMLLAALAVKLEDGGPIFYRQVRTGQGGRPFSIIKFRSMSVNAESAGKAIWAVRNDPRVTRVGAFIRKVRIDELPQVFNVIAGDMSFVGPRPERPEFVQSLARTIPFYDERHFVKPGITGWAQVRYPYGASEDDSREKLGYDLYYVMKHGMIFDIMVLLQTVEIVLFRIGSR
ncbi:MAG: TIGR03013 family PEP-CTERM/XrtA system glycosyltransferase [Lysobacter sp.]|nr:TIGR03013 family PEP-CTERM/XrtA system glycosyltransferase [Lysobacter sp.]